MKPAEYRAMKFASGKARFCWMCRCELTLSTATVDHLIPTSKKGRDQRSNYRLACRPCNSTRGNRRLTKAELAAAQGRPKPKGNAEKIALLASISERKRKPE